MVWRFGDSGSDDYKWAIDVLARIEGMKEFAGYPLDHFILQVTAVLAKLDNARGNWVEISLPAQIAAAVQLLADANFPLRPDHAQGLLWILDVLIDLGDRRSVALEQTEAFKGVNVRSPVR